MTTLINRLRGSSAIMGMLPENPGYNGSVLLIDDTEAARVVKDIDDAIKVLSEAAPVEVAAIPVPTGCGAIFKAPEGWSCDCERDHPAPCAKGKRSDDAGEKP